MTRITVSESYWRSRRGKIILKMVFRQRAFAQRLGCEIGKFVDDIEKLVRAHPHRGGDDLVVLRT